MKNVVIVGAGFSGMSLAYYLVKKGFSVSIIDKNKKSGGLISTISTAKGLYETAANGFLNTAKVENFLIEIGAKYVGSSLASKKRFIFRKFPRRWPLSLFETVSVLFKLVGFFLKPKQQKLAGPAETVAVWSNRHFTTAFTQNLVAPALQGIYAGDINVLSAALIVNPMMQRKKIKKLSAHSLLSATEGMGSLMKDLEKSLIGQGVQFVFGKNWSDEISTDILVIATSASDAAEILKKLPNYEAKENAVLLTKVNMEPLISATCFFEKKPLRYQGFGVLFPRPEGVRALGVLQNNLIFGRPSQAHSETWIFGGAQDREVMSLEDSELKQLIQKSHESVFEDVQQIVECHVTRWPKALPHYTVQFALDIFQLKPMNNIWLHGNYLGSLGLSRILEASEALAETIAKKEVT